MFIFIYIRDTNSMHRKYDFSMTAPSRKPDEIMAEYLLSGAKMLAEICPNCNAPLFEVNGKKLCVVCADAAARAQTPSPAPASGHKPASVPENIRVIVREPTTGAPETSQAPTVLGILPKYAQPQKDIPVSDDISAMLDALILGFCRRAEAEPDPARCLTYLECIRTAAESRVILRR